MPELKKVHVYQRVPNSTEVRLIETNPYICIASRGEPHVFLQGGHYLYEDGTELTELTPLMKDAVSKLSPTALESVGFKAGSLYKCEECGEELIPKLKGVHIANHKKAKKKEED